MKKEQVVVKECGNIGRYRVRAVKFGGSPGLDVREYLETGSFTGFTRKGVFIHQESLPELVEKIQAVVCALDGATRDAIEPRKK